MKRNNKALYESIMRNVSKLVKNALNESLSDKNLIYINSPIESIYEAGKEIRNILERSEWLNKTINEIDELHIRPCIVFTFKGNFMISPGDVNYITNDYSAFMTESGVIVLALYINDDDKYHRSNVERSLLYWISKIVSCSTKDIKFSIYYGLDGDQTFIYDNEEKNEMAIDILKNLFNRDFINMGHGLICVRTDGESYNKFVNVGNDLKKQFE